MLCCVCGLCPASCAPWIAGGTCQCALAPLSDTFISFLCICSLLGVKEGILIIKGPLQTTKGSSWVNGDTG